MTNFSNRLKNLRQFKNLTLDELAQELESTKTTLSRYENDKRTPDANFIIKSSKFFKVSADYILGMTDNPSTIDDFMELNLGVDDMSL